MVNQDGGPAFPRPMDYGSESGSKGMSLRDYFAGQALAILADSVYSDRCAAECYVLADAMLKAREVNRG